MPYWHRLLVFAVIFGAVTLLARFVDRQMAKRELAPEAVTRYRVLRRAVTASILVIGLFSALLVIPQVRAVAGGLLASSAVIGVIIGFASQRTLGNFVAGVLVAIAQPVRLGDRVSYDGEEGVVEEIGLTYTFIRTADQARVVVPNEKLASDTIRNSSIRSLAAFAEVQVQVPLSADLRAARDALAAEVASEPDGAVYVSALNGSATLTVRASAGDQDAAQTLERELRLRAHERLRTLGIWG
jgi:small-conductance mechanosensitive channel